MDTTLVSAMETSQNPDGAPSVIPFEFIMETYPTSQPQNDQQHVAQPTLQPDAQTDPNGLESQPQISEFSQDFYTEGMARRVQPPRARRTDFGKHSADDLIIEAIERAEREKPVIPPETVFFCTTDNSMMPNMQEVLDSIHPAGTGPADELPMHSYFRNAEVMRKIRSQELIETPAWHEATKEDWDEAQASIPEPWRSIPPDTSSEYYRRHHMRLERLEASVRNREKAKLAHDYHHLKSRLAELQQLDASGFRGDTPEEQEKDKVIVLAAAKKLLENQRVKGKVEDEYMEDAEDNAAEILEEDPNRPAKAPRKKKESKWEYYPADFDLDEEIVADSSKKKRSRKKPPIKSSKPVGGSSKKRKREPTEIGYVYLDEEVPLEPEVDMEEDEYVEVPHITTVFKKPKVVALRRSLGPLRGIPREKEKDERASKLLDQARKYNPRRTSRGLDPFGAPFPELDLIDFELPFWLGWDDNTRSVEAQLDEAMEGPAGFGEAASDIGDGSSMRDQQTEDVPETADEGEAEVIDGGHTIDSQKVLPAVKPNSAGDGAESPLTDLTDEDGEQEMGDERKGGDGPSGVLDAQSTAARRTSRRYGGQ